MSKMSREELIALNIEFRTLAAKKFPKIFDGILEDEWDKEDKVDHLWLGFCLGRLSIPQKVNEWKSIETAPKDRQILLAAEFDHPDDWRIKTGWYDNENKRWKVLGASWEPTKWMPLPPPPAMKND